MSFAVRTVNCIPFETEPPFFVTVTLELPAATEGTVATICVSDHEATVAAVVPNFTLPVPCVAPKFLPPMVTRTPGRADVGPTEPTCGVVAVSRNCQTTRVG